jgi:coenzyme F420 hydrogenase subunit beta
MALFKRIRDKLWTKTWSGEQLANYVGPYQTCYFTYATDQAMRERAASGGSVSALLVHLLETDQIDGALVCRTILKDGKPRAEFFIARTREDMHSAQGSKYSAVYFSNDGLPLLNAFEGRVAVVALPCDATILQRTRAKSPTLDQKIILVITLFCGHNSEPELTDGVVKRLGRGHGELREFVWRYGHWRGSLSATFEDGTSINRPFSDLSNYRHLYFFAQQKCHHCFDHFGYNCDISAGDIWLPHMREHPIKHTALITRTPAGQHVVEDALRNGILTGQEESVENVVNGQARTLPVHYNITARARVGRLFGLKIKDRTQTSVRLVDYVIAFLALSNERLSRTRLGRRLIWLIPKPMLKLYVYFFKGLESL